MPRVKRTKVEYRDATFSKPTRDELAELTKWLRNRGEHVRAATAEDILARSARARRAIFEDD